MNQDKPDVTSNEKSKEPRPTKKENETVNNFKGIWKKILSYVAPYSLQLIIIVILSLICSVIGVISPKISGGAVTLLSNGISSGISGPGIDFDELWYIVSKLSVLYLILALSSCIGGYLTTRISVKITYRLRKEISEKLDQIPVDYFDIKGHGEILSRITNDVDALSEALTQSISQVGSSVVLLIGILYMMFSISWQLSLISITILPISMIFASFIIKYSRKYFRDYQKKLGNINKHVEEMYSGHSIVKAFNGEDDSIQKFENINISMYNSSWKSQFFSSFISAIADLSSSIGYISVCVLGGYLASTGKLAIGDIFAFLMYSGQFMGPLMQVAGIAGLFQSAAASGERVFELLDAPEEENISDSPIHIGDKVDALTSNNTVCIKGHIEFRNVSFSYDKSHPVIKDFSLTINPGNTAALVGPTGAGKTTILKLLTRFIEVDSGEILLDGYNIKQFKKEDLRSLFGVVFQDTWLYSDTIMENIRYGKVSASDVEVEEAAILAQADHFIKTVPKGYETILSESADNISHGEKQLLTIARAIISSPSLLILDEATSSVDTHTEQLIQSALKNLLSGKTSLISAHRLSTIRDADIIAVIDKGKIIEQGTHDELFNKNGFYTSLYNTQFQVE